MPGVDQAQVGQRAAVQRRHLSGFVLWLCRTLFKIFGKWGDQFLGLPDHDVIGVAMQFARNRWRSAHPRLYVFRGHGTERG